MNKNKITLGIFSYRYTWLEQRMLLAKVWNNEVSIYASNQSESKDNALDDQLQAVFFYIWLLVMSERMDILIWLHTLAVHTLCVWGLANPMTVSFLRDGNCNISQININKDNFWTVNHAQFKKKKHGVVNEYNRSPL